MTRRDRMRGTFFGNDRYRVFLLGRIVISALGMYQRAKRGEGQVVP